MKKAWIVGASSGLGRALAEELANQGVSLVLSARDTTDLERTAQSFRTIHNLAVDCFAVDLAAKDAETSIYSFVLKNPNIDGIFICVGGASDEDIVPFSRKTLLDIYVQNCLGPAVILNQSIEHLKLKNCVVISSIASRIPRINNACYGASKTALEEIITSLNIYLHQRQRGYQIQVIRLGYMRSRWTVGKKLLFPAAPPGKVASYVISRLDKQKTLSFYPRFWHILHLALRLMPWRLYRNLRF